jgi:hypothetical protein
MCSVLTCVATIKAAVSAEGAKAISRWLSGAIPPVVEGIGSVTPSGCHRVRPSLRPVRDPNSMAESVSNSL